MPQEDRTSIEIGKTEPICLSGNADFSFELGFLPNRATYFGYIFRMVNKSGQNIDLLYNQKDDIFKVVVGAKFTDINFRLPQKQLYDNWTKVRFHLGQDALLCYINGRLIKKTAIQLADRCFQIVFGASRMHNFSTTDVPPMRTRNIAVKDNGKLRYLWPLNNLREIRSRIRLKEKKPLY